MKSIFAGFVCRVLTASLIILPWQAQAGVIGTDQVLNAAQQRAAVAGFVNREDVAAKLEFFGVSPQTARERVAALSNAEVAELAGRIDALPAGGAPSILPVVVAILLVYFLFYVPTVSPKEPAKSGKSAPAPAQEKK